MARTPHKRFRKLKIFLAAVGVGAVGILLAVYIGYRQLAQSPERLVAAINEEAKLSLGKIRQTATRDGKTEWRLDAASAQYLEAKNQVLLADLTVTFFTDEGEDVQLSASEGLLDTESNDIQVSGDVKVANEEYVLTTTGLLYRHATRIISSAAPVLIQRKAGGKLSADSMSLDLNSRLVTMEGNVTGVFDEPGDS